jgi:HK97 family phage major capsid protein
MGDVFAVNRQLRGGEYVRPGTSFMEIEMNLFDLRRERNEVLGEQENILSLCQNENRARTDAEQEKLQRLQTKAVSLNSQIAAIEAHNTLAPVCGSRGFFPAAAGRAVERPWDQPVSGTAPRGFEMPQGIPRYSEDYARAFFTYVATKGTQIDAALYEGSDGAGGYAVPIVVSDQIVPLAPNEMAVRQLAQVVPTFSDIKIPQQASFGTSTVKAENAAFTEGDPSLSQLTLSAFMAGNINTLSWELVQDVPTFQSFAIQDMILAQQMFEENWYVNGTGSGQAQ